MANVIFKVGTRAQYNALLTKDTNTLYWLYDVLELRKGDDLYGTGREATNEVAGLLSPEYKKKLDALIESGTSTMTTLDASVVIDDGRIGVRLSAVEGNAIQLLEDGLFVPVQSLPLIPEFSIEKQAEANEGFGATYRLKRTCGDDASYVGDEINIPKDLVVQGGNLETVVIADQPYVGAQVGDPYIDLILNDEKNSHIYIPVKGLVDVYEAGEGIEILDGAISVKLHPVESNGLFIDENGLGLRLATINEAGAMSAEDKVFLEAIPELFVAKEYEISHKPDGALVDYRDKEIRIMCPSDTEWTLQSSGENSDPNSYYVGFKAYAPSNAYSFREDLAKVIADETMYYFDGNDFAGIDEYGRKYSVVWLPVANFTNDTWTYYGSMSSEDKYIGWDYTVEWYDVDGEVVHADSIRINLSNEECHTKVEPHYVAEITKDITDLQSVVESMTESYTWGDM